jgi:hypothetical protein
MISRIAALLAPLSLCAATVACGGEDGSNPVDAATQDGTPPADAPTVQCSYSEVADAVNATTPEFTGLSVANGKVVICGSIAPNVPTGEQVDTDLYSVTATFGDLLVRLWTVDDVGDVTLVSALAQGQVVSREAIMVGGHAVYASQVPSGSLNFVVTGRGINAPTAPIHYVLEIEVDEPAVRCPGVESTFTEAGDGALHRGNDMVEVRYSTNSRNQTAAADAPEATGLVLAPGQVAITGESASVASAGDDYRDRDTYLIQTGPLVNQLDVRLEWPDATTDLDFMLFPVPTTDAARELGAGTRTGLVAPEFNAVAVEPSTQYWLWVGGYSGTFPRSYGLTLCGSHFQP